MEEKAIVRDYETSFLPARSVSFEYFIFPDVLQLVGVATLDVLFSYSEIFKF